MIQRIQSVYLLAAAILTTILACANLITGVSPEGTAHLSAWGITLDGTDGFIVRTLPLGILAVLAAAAAFFSIFLYKARRLQARIVMAQIALQAGLLAFIAVFFVKLTRMEGMAAVVPSFVDIFPVVNMLLIYLAYRGIMKDEYMIRSVDRIR